MPELPPAADPLILTLTFDGEAAAFFETLRRRHFPEKLNRIPAHATLFHHLDGLRETEMTATIAAIAGDEAPLDVTVTGLRFTGRGVAYVLASDTLVALRAQLAGRFETMLNAQDRQGWRPHVTVQNKVAPEIARALHADLSRGFEPFRFVAPGLTLWRYLGGPWSHRAAFAFGQDPTTP